MAKYCPLNFIGQMGGFYYYDSQKCQNPGCATYLVGDTRAHAVNNHCVVCMQGADCSDPIFTNAFASAPNPNAHSGQTFEDRTYALFGRDADIAKLPRIGAKARPGSDEALAHPEDVFFAGNRCVKYDFDNWDEVVVITGEDDNTYYVRVLTLQIIRDFNLVSANIGVESDAPEDISKLKVAGILKAFKADAGYNRFRIQIADDAYPNDSREFWIYAPSGLGMAADGQAATSKTAKKRDAHKS